MEEKELKAQEAITQETEATADNSPVLDELLTYLDLGADSAITEESEVFSSETSAKMRAGDVVYASLRMLINDVKAREKETGKATLRSSDVDACIAVVDQLLSKQMNEVLHHPKFQDLESSWRGVEFLIKRCNFRKNVKVNLLDVTKDEITQDFQDAIKLDQAQFFKSIYSSEYGTLGGNPFATIIGNYEIKNTPDDLDFLRGVGQVAEAAHAPFIASIGPEFFGLKTIHELDRLRNVGRVFERKAYAAWNEFRKESFAKYIGLTLPRFLLRNPYDPEKVKIRTFGYKEEVKGHNDYLWGNTAMTFAANLAQSFQRHGWARYIVGIESGGKVENLPLHIVELDGVEEINIPTEIRITEAREKEFSDNGFIPLVWSKDSNYAVYFGAQSIAKPKEYDDDAATASARLGARLPYIFAVSRLTHYLKVYQTRKLGQIVDRMEIQDELNKWLKQYVSADKSIEKSKRAKYPFKEASVEVNEISDNPGYYEMKLHLVPHIHMEGMAATLSLVSKLPVG